MVDPAPTSKENTDFNFKLFTRLKVFSGQEELSLNRPNKLVAVSSKYGLIFVGTPSGIQCIRSEDLSPQDEKSNKHNVTNYKRREFQLGTQPTHIDISCDNEYLAITLFHQDCAVLQIYSIKSCVSVDVQKVCQVQLCSTPGVNVLDLQWNPGVPNMIAVAMADGSAAVIEFKDGSFNINSIPQNAQASCLCWSPKGKQVVIGAKNGSLTQYKPELKAVKTFPPPQMGFPLSVISVHWLSNFQFIAAYKNITDPSSKTYVIIVNVPKNVAPRYIYYEDLFCEFDTSRPEHYFIHQQIWNIVIVGTSNSLETSVLKLEGENWVQYTQEDGSRAELPLTDYKDVFNLGIALDTSSIHPVVIGDKLQTAMPLLLMYAHNGVLCLFHVVNNLPGTPSVCQPPEQLQNLSGLHLFTIPTENIPATNKVDYPKPEPSKPKDATPPLQSQQASPGMGLSQIGFTGAVNTPQSSAQLPQVSSTTYGGFGMPPSGSTESAGGLAKSNLFSQISFRQPSLARPATPQNQSLFGQTGLSPLTATSTSPGTAQQLQRLPFPPSQPAQNVPVQPQVTPVQPQTQHLAPQVQSPQGQQFTEVKPTSVTAAPWQQPSGFQPPQPQQPTLSNQLQTAPKTSSSPSGFSNQSVRDGPSTPLNTVKSVVPAASQEPPHTEESEGKDPLRDKKLAIAKCQELIMKFNIEMEERQRIIRTIITKTDQNIQMSNIKEKLIKDIEILRKFEDNLKDSNYPDQAKVNSLGSSIMEMFGWYEKIIARERMTKSSSYVELMESQDLDPVTKNYLKSIDTHIYYLESQIKQAKVKLGTLWDNMESTMEIPVMEAIYQSLVAQHSILAAQKNLIERFETKLKKMNQSHLNRRNRNRARDLELSTLADRLLITKLRDNDTLKDSSLSETANNYLLLANKIGKEKLSEEKVGALYEWHKNHKVIKTKISNSSAIVQTNFLKDTTFNGMLSPSKQSTPYVTTNGTPRKAISSAPRKSLFTLTSLDDQPAIAESSEQVTDIKTAQQSGEYFVQPSFTDNLQNNLLPNSTKTSEGNKVDAVKDLDSQAPSSPSDFSNLTLQMASSQPTPGAFKGVIDPVKGSQAKPESSWTTQAPTFGSSPLFSSISSPTSSTSGFALTGSTTVQSSTNTLGNTAFKTSPIVTGASTASQPLKSSMFSFPMTTSTQPVFSSSPKTSVPILNPNNEAQNQITATTAALTYTPTSLKNTSQSSHGSFNFSGSNKNSLNFGTLNFGAATIQSTTQSQNVTFSNPKTVISLSDPNLLTLNNTAAPNSSPSCGLVSSSSSSVSSSLTITSVPKSSSATPAIVSQTGVFSGTIPPPSKSNLITTSSGILTTNSSSQKNIVATTASQSAIQSALSLSSGVSTPPKSTSTSGTSGSIFGGLGTSFAFNSTTGSIFGNSSESSPSIFGAAGSSNTSIFGSTANTGTSAVASSAAITGSVSLSPLSQPTTTASSITKATVSTTLSLSLSQSPSVPSTSSTSLFEPSSTTTITSTVPSTSSTTAATTTNTTIFGGSDSSSVISTTTASIFGGAPLFGTSFKTPISSSQPFFSNTTSFAASSSASIFGSPATPTTAAFGDLPKTSNVFGDTTTTSSIFGSAPTTTSPTVTSSTTIFGSPTTTTPSSTTFGSTTTTAASPTIFGSPATTATPSVFGNTATTTTVATVFGNAAAATTTTTTTSTATVFGSPATSTVSSSVFGTPASTTATGTIFGTPATTTAAKSFFGAPAAATTTTANSIFGGSSTFGPTQGNSVFGATNSLSSTSFFGSATTTTSQNFGSSSPASIFGGSSSFGATATTTSSSASFFGKPICSPTSTTANVFGSGGNVFGQSTTTTAGSIFGGSGSFQQKTPFGQPGSVFGQTASSGGTFGSSGGSLFGGTASFSNPTSQQGNLFQSGASSGNIFGGGSPGGPFSSPQTGQATFGAPPSFQTPQRPFGSSSPGFGSSPAFGSPPTFGGAPAFGSSPNKVFGSPPGAAAPAFGSPAQQSTNTFETLAQQETLSFGNLAQPQQQQQTFPNSSFAGSSFSSWR